MGLRKAPMMAKVQTRLKNVRVFRSETSGTQYLYMMAAVGPPQGEKPALAVHSSRLLHLRYSRPFATKKPTMMLMT